MLRVYALSCGSLEFDRSLFFPASAAGLRIAAPVSSYLIVHPKGKLLFDTGIHCDALTDPVARLGKRIASLFAIRSRAGEDVVSQLAALGVGPDDIRYVVNSHFHFDHCGCNAFVSACAIPGAARGARSPRAPNRSATTRRTGTFRSTTAPSTASMTCSATARVVLLPTPGHTPGHQSLWIRASGAAQFVLTGDACYTREHLEIDDTAHEYLRRRADDGIHEQAAICFATGRESSSCTATTRRSGTRCRTLRTRCSDDLSFSAAAGAFTAAPALRPVSAPRSCCARRLCRCPRCRTPCHGRPSVRTIGSPAVTLTPCSRPIALTGPWPWSWYMATTRS